MSEFDLEVDDKVVNLEVEKLEQLKVKLLNQYKSGKISCDEFFRADLEVDALISKATIEG
jgi:hypothetical protein